MTSADRIRQIESDLTDQIRRLFEHRNLEVSTLVLGAVVAGFHTKFGTRLTLDILGDIREVVVETPVMVDGHRSTLVACPEGLPS